MHRSRSRFSNVYAGYHCTCSTHRWNSYDFHNPWCCIRRYGTSRYGCAGCPNTCSRNHSSCCGCRSHRTNIRNSGNSFRAGAAMRNTVPMIRNSCCDRWHKSSQILSDRKRRNTNDSRCWYRSLPAHSGESMYGCRNPGKSTNHTNRNRGLYTHKSPNFEHNDRDNIHNTADVLWKCATEKRMFPAKSSSCFAGAFLTPDSVSVGAAPSALGYTPYRS